MEKIDDECDNVSIPLVKINDQSKAIHYGIERTPQLLYFKRGVPGLFDGDMADFPEIYNWLVRQKRSAGIQGPNSIEENSFGPVLVPVFGQNSGQLLG